VSWWPTSIVILTGMGRHIVFKCPQTDMNVQHWLATVPDDPEGTHRPVVCPACTKLHFINSSTGKLLSEADK
jgi:hypothetical protein